tara:strand:- start:667 stop:972 length:306 start_codon:yes stop_codon:yes gene_type:complete
VKPLNLPKKLPEKIILRCGKCNSSKNIVGVWRGNRFLFTEEGISKKSIMNAIDFQKYKDAENNLAIEQSEYFNDYPDTDDQNYDEMSPLEWDDGEEEWTSF